MCSYVLNNIQGVCRNYCNTSLREFRRTIFSEFAMFCHRQTTMIPCDKQCNFDECFDGEVNKKGQL